MYLSKYPAPIFPKASSVFFLDATLNFLKLFYFLAAAKELMEPSGVPGDVAPRHIAFVGLSATESSHDGMRKALVPRSAKKVVAPIIEQKDTSQCEKPLLVHHSHGCPGFTGPDSQQRVQPMTFRTSILRGQLVIPLFQRRYCWTEAQGRQWFHDVRQSRKRNGWNGAHTTGKIVVKKTVPLPQQPSADRPDMDRYVCVDGQQRHITTTMLLLALRLAAGKLLPPSMADDEENSRKVTALLYEIDRLLSCASSPAEEECKFALSEGHERWKASEWRLVPSLADREDFTRCFLAAGASTTPASSHAAFSTSSPMTDMFMLFRELVENELTTADATPPIDRVSLILRQAVDEMYVVSTEILNDVNLCQVFLWLQEKAILGEGALLYNATPGVAFRAGDLVRNCLLAPRMLATGDVVSDALEEMYVASWLTPIERPLTIFGNGSFDRALDTFLAQFYHDRARDKQQHHEKEECCGSSQLDPEELASWASRRSRQCAFEVTTREMVNLFESKGLLKYPSDSLLLYACFQTFLEDIAMTTSSSPASIVECVEERVLRMLRDFAAAHSSLHSEAPPSS